MFASDLKDIYRKYDLEQHFCVFEGLRLRYRYAHRRDLITPLRIITRIKCSWRLLKWVSQVSIKGCTWARRIFSYRRLPFFLRNSSYYCILFFLIIGVIGIFTLNWEGIYWRDKGQRKYKRTCIKQCGMYSQVWYMFERTVHKSNSWFFSRSCLISYHLECVGGVNICYLQKDTFLRYLSIKFFAYFQQLDSNLIFQRIAWLYRLSCLTISK